MRRHGHPVRRVTRPYCESVTVVGAARLFPMGRAAFRRCKQGVMRSERSLRKIILEAYRNKEIATWLSAPHPPTINPS